MILCSMCDEACLALETMESIAPIGFFCGNPECIAEGVVFTPEGFDPYAWSAEWGNA